MTIESWSQVVPGRSPELWPGNGRRKPFISVARCSLVANLAGMTPERTPAPSAVEIMMTKMFYAKAFLSRGTTIWSFTGKPTMEIFILVMAVFFSSFA